MVLLGLPEPPREPYEEDLSMGEAGQNIIIANTSSDSEDERDNAGYELLPMDGFDGIENADSDSENSNGEESQEVLSESVLESEDKLTSTTVSTALDEPGTSNDLKQIWSAPRPERSIVMDAAHMNQVKAAMASFHLPASSIPPWAVEVTEDHWKDTLLNKLKNLHDQRGSK